jgi:nicotinamide mononucleotide adenylyltransferase
MYVIGGIVSPVSDAYKKVDMISAKHRCEMVRMAVKSYDWIRYLKN